jgi:hypothetical protein
MILKGYVTRISANLSAPAVSQTKRHAASKPPSEIHSLYREVNAVMIGCR